MVLHLNKFESPLPKDALKHNNHIYVSIWLKMAQQFLRRRFLNMSMYFRYFVIISP